MSTDTKHIQGRRALVAASIIMATAGLVSTSAAATDADPAMLPGLFNCGGKTATIVSTGYIYGTPGNDVILATGTGNDWVYGDGGNDTICTGQGNDTVLAGPGADVVFAGPGEDRLEGNAGADQLRGEDGVDVLLGGQGNDLLDGGAGPDYANYLDATGPVQADLAGGGATGFGNDTFAGVESLVGSSFADVLNGDGASNSITGNGGADVINARAGCDIVHAEYGSQQIDGGSGQCDVVEYATLASVSVDLATGKATGKSQANVAETDTLAGFEDIRGSQGDDVLLGSNQANTILSGGGTDRIEGRGGDDQIWVAPVGHTDVNGNAGNDTCHVNMTYIGDLFGCETIDS